jgi:NAD+ synthase (glutamine-hydrolysing)
MAPELNIGFLQINPIPGDILNNQKKILIGYQQAIEQGADLVLGPELALMGYWPGDLLQNEDILEEQSKTLINLAKNIQEIPLVIGCVEIIRTPQSRILYNAAAWCEKGSIQAYGRKCLLPNYNVFEEKRHFHSGEKPLIRLFKNKKIGITICEDIWTHPDQAQAHSYDFDPVLYLKSAHIDYVLNLSASPWHRGHPEKRLKILKRAAQETQAPVAYCNTVGGNECLLFDGRSLGIDSNGEIAHALPAFETAHSVWTTQTNTPTIISSQIIIHEPITELYQALVFGLKEYAQKTGFNKVVLGISGGIDSAVVAAIAEKALGKNAVLGVALPSAISSEHSLVDAEDLAQKLGIELKTIPIQSSVNLIADYLETKESLKNLTHENLQARIRGLILMGLSNEDDRLLLTTGNKSEMAMGYCTLYGDMCGGLNILGDVYKTDVYQLAHEINRQANKTIINQNILTKAPSAELRPGQKDQDSLPPYDILDLLLYHLLEKQISANQLIQQGYDKNLVNKIQTTLTKMEYKRHQSTPILRTSALAFGPGRRMPIIQK